MVTGRPLPTVIGPTENALRALLQHTLLDSPINGYVEWVAMNYTDGAPEPAVHLAERLAGALKVDAGTIRDALDGLEHRGLVTDVGDAPVLTPHGQEALQRARRQVQARTARLVEGLSDEDLTTTVRVLDHVRTNAEHELP